MPSYRSITLSLRVPANCKEVAEYEPPPPTPYSLPQSTRNNLQPSHPPSTNLSNIHDPFTSPPVTLLDVPRSIVSVYIIIHDNSNFWLQYSIAPPYPPNALYYFKLFISGTEVASWGCGEEDGWRGCTMWGIFAGDDGRMERRDFFWGKQTDGGDGVMEVKVFRARGRMRVVPEVGRWEGLESGGREISVNKGGALPRKLPRRYYRYALLDSLDAPFATFRYYCRSWRQLNALGIEDLLSDSSRPTSRSSHDSSSKNDEQGRKDEHRQRDDCSSTLSTNTGSSGSSGAGASSGEELLTQFASSGLKSSTDLTKANGTATDLPSTPSKPYFKKSAEPTNLSSSPTRHIPHPLPLIPKSSFSSVAPPQAPLKESPVSNDGSPAPPPVPPKHSRPSPNSIPPRSALFEPRIRHDSLTPSTFPSKNPLRTPPPLPPRKALFSPKPDPMSLPTNPQRGLKSRSSREHFAAMIREGFPSPEAARWKLDEERYGSSGNDSADNTPEEERAEGEDRKVGKGDSMEKERLSRGGGSGEGKALKQGTLRMGMLKRVVGGAVSRKREG